MIKNKSNFNYKELKNERKFGISQTIPDQTMSMRTLLERHARGLSLTAVGKEEIFDENQDLTRGIDTRTLDLVDIQEIKEEFQSLEEKNKMEQEERVKARAEAKKLKEQEEFRKKLEEEIRGGLIP